MRAVVIGSGLAGVTVAEALAQSGSAVRLVTAEAHGYYSRPRLSHGVALSDELAAKIVMKRFDALPFPVTAGTRVESIDRENRRVIAAGGASLEYDVLVLATGSAARIPPALAASDAYFLTLNSYGDLLELRRRRRQALQAGRPHWAVIGGGLIGCELASDLHKAGDAVTLFHREPRLLELQLDEEQSAAMDEHFARLGIAVRYKQDVRAITSGSVVTAEGEIGPFDAVIVSTGFAPRVELARQAGLPVGRGILVDRCFRTQDPAIYAAGDVAQVGERLFPFVSPIRSQALWLAEHLAGRKDAPWTPPAFAPVIKIHGFKLPAAVAA